MSEDEVEKPLDEHLLLKMGWLAHKFEISPDQGPEAILDEYKRKRAKERGLKRDASWFEIFCTEIRDGISTDVPYEFREIQRTNHSGTREEVEDATWQENIRIALRAAQAAAKIFMPKESRSRKTK